MVALPIDDGLSFHSRDSKRFLRHFTEIFSTLVWSLTNPAKTQVFDLGLGNLMRTFIRHIDE
jgi:hypothetical protein